MEEAYTAMGSFAGQFGPSLFRVIDVQPFFEWVMHTDIFKLRWFKDGKVLRTSPFGWMETAGLFKRDYRDHIVHQVRVATIGSILLQEKVGARTLLEQAAEALEAKLGPLKIPPKKFITVAWWLAALLHDCGYPYQFHYEAFQRLRKIYRIPLGSPTRTAWFPCHQDLALLAGPLRPEDVANCQQGRHSFMSAAELASAEFDYERGMGKGEGKAYRRRRRALFSLATQAILCHHGPSPVSFRDNPLGFLLILSDEIHEAERPLAIPSTSGSTALMEYQSNAIEAVETQFIASGSSLHLELTYHCPSGTTHISGRPRKIWAEKKENDLKRNLRLGPGEILGDICVEVSAGP
jgi:hypothetical protein